MKIRLITVGKVKEKYFTDAIAEYSKRLSKYTTLEIVEVPDEMTPDKAKEGEIASILAKEGDRILSKIADKDYVVTLEIEGKKVTSEGLSDKLESIMNSGNSTIDFIIGGSLGLDQRIKKRSNFALSFSDMTFPHQLMRVVLLEQIYRAFKIINHEPYHK